jgi:polyvinyl alcohol dehydrogenase (cytochrome)
MRRSLLPLAVLFMLSLASLPAQQPTAQPAPAPAQAGTPASGEAIYKLRCAGCHDNAVGRTPPRAALQQMTRQRIMRTLDFGAMMTIAYNLRRNEREAVVNFLGLPGDEPGPRPEAFCADRTVRLGDVTKASWNGWSPARDNARFAPAALAGLTAEQVPKLKLKWAFGFEGDSSAFAMPTVIGNQIFVGSAGGRVHALRADTGCLQWVYQATGPIRAAPLAVPHGAGHVLLFGDLTGWFYAIDAATGKEIWKKRPEIHEAVRLSAPPLVHNGLVLIPVASWEESRSVNQEYVCCTFRGSITALRLQDGTEAWKTYTVPRRPEVTGKTSVGTVTMGPSGVGVWSTPTVDVKRNRMYITTGNNYSSPGTDTSDAVMALDMTTGRILWTRQVLADDIYNSACAATTKGPSCPEEDGPDHDFGSPAVLTRTPAGRDIIIAGQKAGVVWAFDPDRNGQVLWSTRVGQGGINGGILWGMASDGEHVYATVSDAVIDRTPMARVLNPKLGGGLTALRVADGTKAWVWQPPPCAADRPNCSPAQSAAVTAIPGAVFAGSMDGHLRAYNAKDGTVIWDFDTVRDYQTVNGVPAKGGAVDGPGAVVVNGMVLVNSGYTRQGGLAGNVLLAFSAE